MEADAGTEETGQEAGLKVVRLSIELMICAWLVGRGLHDCYMFFKLRAYPDNNSLKQKPKINLFWSIVLTAVGAWWTVNIFLHNRT
jgi:hypothetical protein